MHIRICIYEQPRSRFTTMRYLDVLNSLMIYETSYFFVKYVLYKIIVQMTFLATLLYRFFDKVKRKEHLDISSKYGKSQENII